MKIIKNVEIKKITKKKCDFCGTLIQYDSISIDHTFGYGSKRDGSRMSIDICEECVVSVFGDRLVNKGLEEGFRLSGEGL